MPILNTKAFIYDFHPDDQINGDLKLRKSHKIIAAVLQLPENWGCYLVFNNYSMQRVELSAIEDYLSGKPTIVKAVVGSEYRIYEYEKPNEWTHFKI